MKKLVNLALAATAGVTATLIGLPASSASAAPVVSSVVKVSNDFDASTSGDIRGTLQCPAGDRLVGAGGARGGATVVLRALAPTADNTGATLLAHVVEPAPDPGEDFAQLSITCAPTSQFTDVVTVRTNDHRFSPGTFAQGISRCPTGYYAFGGGGYFTAGGVPLGAASSNATNTPSADGSAWTYAGVTPPGVQTTMVIVTQCAPRTGHDVLVQFGNVSTSSTAETSSFVDCPSGYTAIAGGFYASNSDGSVSTTASAENSFSVGGRWFVSGFTPPHTKLVALAQCLR